MVADSRVSGATRKSERLLNLLIMLLVQTRPVPKHRIRGALYPGSGVDAFEKMFERDKEELRALGIPIEVVTTDPLFDEPGYRINEEQLRLPDVQLEPDEAAILAVAGRAWQNARLSERTREGLRKLAALGVPFDEHELDMAAPRAVPDEPGFVEFWEAAQNRVPIGFDYRRPGGEITRRHVEPWGVVRSSGRWYLVAHDLDRDARRTFRISRVIGVPQAEGVAGSYQVPDDVDVRTVAERLVPPAPDVRAVLLVRPGRGHGLRQRADSIEAGVVGPDGQDWDRLGLTVRGNQVVDEVLGYGPDAVLLEPTTLRAELVARLREQQSHLNGSDAR